MKELGIRTALGASNTHVITAAVGRPALLLAVGLVLGLLLSISASRFFAQIVYQANPKDPLVLAGTVLSMLILGISASTIPAARALAVDPAKLMRED
jgi:ABC-type antimicrobial peptide transport system permease subunit